MFSACHQSLIDHFRSVVSSSIDMHTLLHYRIRSGAEGFPRLVATSLDLRFALLAILGILVTHNGPAWLERSAGRFYGLRAELNVANNCEKPVSGRRLRRCCLSVPVRGWKWGPSVLYV